MLVVTRKLISSDEGYESLKQHTKPCADCPFRRDALPGWLGGSTPEEYRAMAHQDTIIDCHVITNQQCAGAAIYRRNVAKSCRDGMLVLERDKETVFGTPMEFLEHHERKKK